MTGAKRSSVGRGGGNRRPLGFTLLELQVSMALLMLSVTGLSAVLMNDLKQMRWLEARARSRAWVSLAPPRVVFSELHPSGHPPRAAQRVRLRRFAREDGSLTAVVSLEEK